MAHTKTAVSYIPTRPQIGSFGQARMRWRRIAAAVTARPYIAGYDTVGDYNAIPADAALVFSYIDGKWPNTVEVAARWPHAIRPTLTTGWGAADFVDCEPGNASWTLGQGPDWDGISAWMNSRRAAGAQLVGVYLSAAYSATCVDELAARGHARSTYKMDVAHWTGRPHVCAPDVCGYTTADCTQWAGNQGGRNGYDRDLALPNAFTTPAPAPKPTPAVSTEEDDMPFVIEAGPTPGNAPASGQFGQVSPGDLFLVGQAGKTALASQSLAASWCVVLKQPAPWDAGSGQYVWAAADLANFPNTV